MICQLKIQDKTISYSLKYNKKKKRCSISLLVNIFGQLKVTAHPSMEKSQINELIIKQASWIDKNVSQRTLLLKDKKVITYEPGDNFYYLGKKYYLEIIDRPQKNIQVILTESSLRICAPERLSRENKIRHIEKWYRQQALFYFSERLDRLCLITPWVTKKPLLKVRRMKRQWGNFYSNGIVTLNIHLIKLPTYLIDYVILHELCHFQEHNHSRRFYQLLQDVVPNWKQYQKEIKEYVYHFYELS
ncbi:MAG: DUF45 domain-containing protein [Neisseriaceae bacterium]|nr:MAG: DUF45 domain-containing protein [Neisseriaceae bacterium]